MKSLILERYPSCEKKRIWLSEPRPDGSTWWACSCDNKKCGVQPQTAFCASKEAAAAIWNKRPCTQDPNQAMQFVFNDEKARALGYSAEACYEVIDELFARFDIYPVKQGVYVAPDNQNTFNAFIAVHKLAHSNWFLKVIDEWLCYEEGGITDCLALYKNPKR